MAEQIISPGVFTRENDQSFLPQGVGAIGAAIVGPTVKGPAFVPTVVRSFAEYERMFGGLSSETFVPQTVREYLRNAGSVTVTRVLAGGGYTFTDGLNEPQAVIATKVVSSETVGEFATASFSILSTPSGSYIGSGQPDELIISGVNFTFVSSSAGYENSSTQIFVSAVHDAGIVGPATALYTAFSSNTTLHNIPLSASENGGSSPNGKIDFKGTTRGTSGNVTILTSSQVPADGRMRVNATAVNSNRAAQGALGGTNPSTGEANNILLGVIYPSKNLGLNPSLDTSELNSTDGVVTPSVTGSFNVKLSGTGVTTTQFSASIDPGNNDYLFKILGNNPNNSKTSADAYSGTPGYTYLNFKSLQTDLQTTASLTGSGYPDFGISSSLTLSGINANNLTFRGLTSQDEGYSYASTPFITSQINLGEKALFKFHSLGHGDECNTDYKISIANLREPADIDNEEQYSTFSILIRRYNDTDKNPIILEQYNNCNLDPNSSQYIARVIGDRYPQYNDTLGKVELLGNYPNVSRLCRVEVSENVAAGGISPKLSPKGFEAVSNPIPSSSFTTTFTFPSASYEGVQAIGGNYNTRACLGWKFDDKQLDNKNFLKPLPSVDENNVSGKFNVENYNGHPDSSLWLGSLSASIDTTGANGPTADQLKFSVCFQGGFDGIAPFRVRNTGNESQLNTAYELGNNLYGFDMTAGASGSEGYKKAINILSNQDEYDINMLAIPGVIKSIPGHSIVTDAAIDMCEERGDTFYIMDLTKYNSSVNTAINDASGLDTNYAAAYFPWVKVNGPSGVPVLVPPSVIVPGAIAASDRIAAEWFAPAGLNRGVLGNVIEAKMRLNQSERDLLYNAKINPIATFPQTGVCIWGQKTLQERSSALDRINVRRLLIALKKFIASSSRYLVFEQNTNQTRNRFLNIVNPYLESVQQRQGLYSFRVQMDEANNTADVVDRNQLVGAIYLQPTKTAEFIVLDFNVLPTGATFDGAGGY